MSDTLNDYLAKSADVIRDTAAHLAPQAMEKAIDLCVTALKSHKPLLVCGNGGSAADAMHIAGELVARFLLDRKGFNCICLSENPAMLTAWCNDHSYDTVFSRQVEAFGKKDAVLIAISTSGNSKNILKAVEMAKSMEMSVVGLTGQGGGKMAPFCDVLIDAPSRFTPLIQQAHCCLYHYLCERIEARMVAETTEWASTPLCSSPAS